MRVILQLENSDLSSSFHYMIKRAFYLAKVEDSWNMAELKDDHEGVMYKTCCGNIFTIDIDCENNNPHSSLLSFEGTRASFRELRPFEETLSWVSQERTGEDFYLTLKARYKDTDSFYKLRLVEYETSTPREWNLGPLDVVEKINENEALIKRFNNLEKVPYKNLYEGPLVEETKQ